MLSSHSSPLLSSSPLLFELGAWHGPLLAIHGPLALSCRRRGPCCRMTPVFPTNAASRTFDFADEKSIADGAAEYFSACISADAAHARNWVSCDTTSGDDLNTGDRLSIRALALLIHRRVMFNADMLVIALLMSFNSFNSYNRYRYLLFTIFTAYQ